MDLSRLLRGIYLQIQREELLLRRHPQNQNKFLPTDLTESWDQSRSSTIKARELYRERGSLQARGIFSKSITTKELFDLYAKDQSYRIHKETKTGLIQISYDAKLKRLGYWIRFVESLGYKSRKIEQIPSSVGRQFKDWIYKQPKERYKDRPRDIQTINAIVGAAKSMYKLALDEKHIGYDDAPQFEYFDAIVDDDKIKRQVLTAEGVATPAELHAEDSIRGTIPKITGTQLMVNRQFMLYIHTELRNRMPTEGTRRPAMEAITKSVHLEGDLKNSIAMSISTSLKPEERGYLHSEYRKNHSDKSRGSMRNAESPMTLREESS